MMEESEKIGRSEGGGVGRRETREARGRRKARAREGAVLWKLREGLVRCSSRRGHHFLCQRSPLGHIGGAPHSRRGWQGDLLA